MTRTELVTEIRHKLNLISAFHFNENVTDKLFNEWSDNVEDLTSMEALERFLGQITLSLELLGI